ncbi:MAG TPA: DUF4870 domain-containing protein [Candidatus Elarobacter sp.]
MVQASSPGDRNWAVVSHLTAVLNVFSAPLPGLLGSIVTYALTRDRDELARETAREALNMQITLMIVELALVISMVLVMVNNQLAGLSSSFWLLLCGAIACVVASIVFAITGATRAARGELYRYPLAIRFVK